MLTAQKLTVIKLRKIRGSHEYVKNLDRIKAWSKLPHAKERIKEAQRKYKERNRIKKLTISAINRSRKSGMECDKEYLDSLIALKPEQCPCCNNALDYSVDSLKRHHPKWRSPSLDRIDTRKGYIQGNVDIICWRCNALKRDGTLEELRAILTYMEKVL
jgi:hypothetical protein